MPNGPMLRTVQACRRPDTTGLSLDSAFGWKRTGPTDADFDVGAVHLGVHNRIGLWWDAQPNESRLSCGAKLKSSQTECYHTGALGVIRRLCARAPPASSACKAALSA